MINCSKVRHCNKLPKGINNMSGGNSKTLQDTSLMNIPLSGQTKIRKFPEKKYSFSAD